MHGHMHTAVAALAQVLLPLPDEGQWMHLGRSPCCSHAGGGGEGRGRAMCQASSRQYAPGWLQLDPAYGQFFFLQWIARTASCSWWAWSAAQSVGQSGDSLTTASGPPPRPLGQRRLVVFLRGVPLEPQQAYF